MMGGSEPSAHSVDQRIRDRIIDVVEIWADGEDGVRKVGFSDYFEYFYDLIPHRDDGVMPSNSAITADEHSMLQALRRLIDDACDATPRHMTDDEFIATMWPKRIQSLALETLNLMPRCAHLNEASGKAPDIERH